MGRLHRPPVPVVVALQAASTHVSAMQRHAAMRTSLGPGLPSNAIVHADQIPPNRALGH